MFEFTNDMTKIHAARSYQTIQLGWNLANDIINIRLIFLVNFYQITARQERFEYRFYLWCRVHGLN